MYTCKQKTQLKALTIKRPWSSAIVHFGKNIENRSWKCPLKIGELIAIHSGFGWDHEASKIIAAINFEQSQYYGGYLDEHCGYNKGEIIAVAEFGGNLEESYSPWFIGPYGWRLNNVKEVSGIYCKGQLGLWNVPDDLRKKIFAQIQISQPSKGVS